MSDDPETLRQIEELSHDSRPLLVLDVDDVLLEFVRPLPRFLEKRGYRLTLESFRLFGNITHVESGRTIEPEEATGLIDDFFMEQADWQAMTEGAAEALAHFGDRAEVILLTMMPHRHRDARRLHLEALGMNYPLLTTEMAKGPAIKRLRGDSNRPVVFVDDQPRNLASARESVPDVHLIHLMADNSLRKMLPEPPDGAYVVEDWKEATPIIAAALGI